MDDTNHYPAMTVRLAMTVGSRIAMDGAVYSEFETGYPELHLLFATPTYFTLTQLP